MEKLLAAFIGRLHRRNVLSGAISHFVRLLVGIEQEDDRFGAYSPGMLLDEQDPIHLSESDSEDTLADLPRHSAEASFSFSRRMPHAPADYTHIISLLQQQQETLQEVLTGQKALEKRQDQFGSDIVRLQSNVQMLRESTQSSTADSESDRKRKRIVTIDLSVSMGKDY